MELVLLTDKSAHIRRCTYDTDTHTLVVRYANGADYAYSMVTEEEWGHLERCVRSDESLGTLMNVLIKPHHSYEKQRDPDPKVPAVTPPGTLPAVPWRNRLPPT